MKTILINMVLVVTIAAPGAASAQSICEGLTIMLTADKDELELYQPPGATMCEAGYGRLHARVACIWPKPSMPEHLYGKGLHWVNTTYMPDVKKLANAVRQCIEQNKIPGNWDSLRTKKLKGHTFGYFFQKSRNQTEKMSKRSKRLNETDPLTISVCFISDADNDAGTAGIILSVRETKRGKSHCLVHF